MLEPRRLGVRAEAERMASELREQVGQTVGYRIRLEAGSGPNPESKSSLKASLRAGYRTIPR